MLNEHELEKVLDPTLGGNINFSVLESINNIIKKNKGKPVEGRWTIAMKILDWIGNADMYDTKTYDVLSKYLAHPSGTPEELKNKDDSQKIEMLEKITNKLIKRGPKFSSVTYYLKAIAKKIKS